MAYHRPTELTDALRIRAEAGGAIVAGGTDFFPSMPRGAAPDPILDLTRIDGFRGITRDGNVTRIGAAATWSDVVRADLPPAFDALKAAAREVGSVQIQNAGTLAGNLCNASPAADGVPPLMILDASVEVASAARGRRALPLSQFISGPRKTALAPDELVTAILVPDPPEGAGSAFEKLGARRYLVISITMVAALVQRDEAGRILHARVAVGAAAPVACRLPDLERDLIGTAPGALAITQDHLSPLSPIDDVRGSGAYRRDVVAAQISRAIERASR